MTEQKNRNEQLRVRQQQRFHNKSAQLASKYLQKLNELPGAPEELGYFTDLLRTVFVENEAVKEEEETLIGTFCVMMPQELVYAAGARPVKLCSGNYVGFQLGDDVSPRDACPLVKSVIGNHITASNELYNACDLYIVPVSCDCKKKMIPVLKRYKETQALYVPLNKTDDESMELYVRELKLMTEKISARTGVSVTREALGRKIREVAEVQREIRRFMEFKQEMQPLLRGSHAMIVQNAMAYDHYHNWGKALKALNEELEAKKKAGEYLTKKKLPRILLTGSPITFPNLKIPLLIEEIGGLVTADETCLGDRGLYDPVAVCEDSLEGYYRALANRYVAACTCPVFDSNTQRIRRIEQLIRTNQVEGIVYHVLRGCLVYDYEYAQLEAHFSKMGIPIIRVESDYNEEDIEQLRIRLEAFVEMIKFRRK